MGIKKRYGGGYIITYKKNGWNIRALAVSKLAATEKLKNMKKLPLGKRRKK